MISRARKKSQQLFYLSLISQASRLYGGEIGIILAPDLGIPSVRHCKD